MKHAFLILVHKDYDQVLTLIKMLKFGEIFIHVDAKAEKLYKKLKELESQHPGLYILDNRVLVNWSGISQVKASYSLLKKAYLSGGFDYFHLISGQDLLLVNQDNLDNWIYSHGSKNFIECKEAGYYSWRLNIYSFFGENPNNRKIFYRLINIFTRFIQIPFVKRKEFNKQKIWMGSGWFSIRPDAVKYIVDKIENDHLLDKYHHTACADEHLYQMILMNSPLIGTLDSNTGRYIRWEGGASPQILTLKDEPELNSGKYIFGRKFDSKIDQNIVDKVIKKQ